MSDKIQRGDFTNLAQDYSLYRPSYSEDVLSAIINLSDKPVEEIDFVDVGAGTGIWTRMVASRNVKSAIAIEPNNEMRLCGIRDSTAAIINWRKGGGEETGLANNCCDLLSMASSFHWVDFTKSTEEFKRILRPGGLFVALWNPRLIEVNPVLLEIEEHLKKKVPGIDRVSSGRSSHVEELMERLFNLPGFEPLLYIEGRHVVRLTHEQYEGVWNSVNDIRNQAGPELFSEFISYMKKRVADLPFIESTYQTRAWIVRKAL